jgi:hypothetical protein
MHPGTLNANTSALRPQEAQSPNAQRNAEIVAKRKRGWEPSDIAYHMGLSRNTVIGVLFRAGLTNPHSPNSSGRGRDYPADLRRAAVEYAREHSNAKAAARFGASATAIKDWRLGRGPA